MKQWKVIDWSNFRNIFILQNWRKLFVQVFGLKIWALTNTSMMMRHTMKKMMCIVRNARLVIMSLNMRKCDRGHCLCYLEGKEHVCRSRRCGTWWLLLYSYNPQRSIWKYVILSLRLATCDIETEFERQTTNVVIF